MSLCFLGICILAGKITYLEGGTSQRPLINTAKSYDNVSRDVSRFYKPKGIQVNGSGYIITNTDTKIDIGYSNGVKTEKFEKGDTYKIGVTQYFPSEDKKHLLSVGVSYTMNGSTNHSPCMDELDRAYYCGNLTAWSDFDQDETQDDYGAQIRYTYRF